jgi:hypothetical protein
MKKALRRQGRGPLCQSAAKRPYTASVVEMVSFILNGQYCVLFPTQGRDHEQQDRRRHTTLHPTSPSPTSPHLTPPDGLYYKRAVDRNVSIAVVGASPKHFLSSLYLLHSLTVRQLFAFLTIDRNVLMNIDIYLSSELTINKQTTNEILKF